MDKKKIIRITTAAESLDDLLVGQLKYLNQYFDIVAVAKDDGRLQKVKVREGVRVADAPIERPISLINVSSTNLEQSKLCVNSPLYIDTRLLWEQTIGSNSTQ